MHQTSRSQSRHPRPTTTLWPPPRQQPRRARRPAAARANGAPVDERAWAALERLRTNDRVAWAAYVADVDADRGVPLLHAALDAVALDFDVDGIDVDDDDLDLADFVAQAATVLKERGAARPRDLALLARAEGDVDVDG